MSLKDGEKTGQFGKWLSEHLANSSKNRQLTVYYDHGNPLVDKNVVAIKGSYGEKVNRLTQLADVDVLVAGPGNEALVLIEIEERISSPKKIVGDVITILMCNHFSAILNGNRVYFSISPRTHLIIAGIVNPLGSKQKQLVDVIFPRLKMFTPPAECIKVEKVSSIFLGDIHQTIEKLKEKVELIIENGVSLLGGNR